MSWGIGIYVYTDDSGVKQSGYGYPWKGMNPNDYTPDPECCSEKEIEAWKKAKEEYVKE